MRSGDPAAPVLPPPGHAPAWEVAQHLRIGVERVPSSGYAWDDPAESLIVWDADGLVWDAPASPGWVDAVCDFMTLTLEAGRPDADGLVESAVCRLTVDNRSGAWSQRDANGRLTYYALGRRVVVTGYADGQWWYLFSGRVTAWDEHTDDTVTITAHDGFATLASDAGTTWTPGPANQTVAARIGSILATWSYTDPTDLEATSTLLGAPATQRSPLEEAQVSALSDGGWLFGDADGDLVYRGRAWLTGRADQTVVHTVSDNVCEAVVVWELDILTDDIGLASTVRLENYETPTPKVATASVPAGTFERSYVVSHPEPDLWTAQADGNQLAADLLARYRSDAPRFTYQAYLNAPDRAELWRVGIDCRLGDRVNVLRTQPAAGGQTAWLDVDLVVTTLVHEITPEQWLTSVETSRVVTYRYPEMWDRTVYVWDEDNPLAVWRL